LVEVLYLPHIIHLYYHNHYSVSFDEKGVSDTYIVLLRGMILELCL